MRIFFTFAGMESFHSDIEKRITHLRAGSLIFPTDFRSEVPASAIKMTLSRLAAEGKIQRLAHGIYYKPKKDPVLGKILPSPEKVAELVAKKEKVHIKPSGAYALHQLGLTTQVPTRLLYLTDGPRREINLGKMYIQFKPTTPKKMSLEGPVSSLIIQALDELGTDNIDDKTKSKMSALLKKEKPALLKKDLALAPTHIYDYILKFLL